MEFLILGAGAFLAGLVDAVVGGGGLIQLPLMLAVLPQVPIPIIFGTNKVSSIAGTASAAWAYSSKIKLDKRIALPGAIAALVGSAIGASVVSFLSSEILKPLVLVMLVLVGGYTFLKRDFGREKRTPIVVRHIGLVAALIGLSIGFYDGFFGPGTGSFLIFAFVRLFGMDMLHASATAKVVNFATNLAAIVYFSLHAGVLWKLGLFMAIANVAGAQVGTRLALRHGNGFVRWLLLAVVSVLIVKLGLDVLRG
ncbi:MAG: TSUP family transporter [Rhodocyclaceae bacterium]